MDRELVIETLKATLPKMKEITTAGLSLSERLKFSRQVQELECSEPLAQVLENQDEFKKPKNIHFNHGSGGSCAFQPSAAALFLCRQAEQVGAEAAVDSLIDIFAKAEADLLCVMALRGVSCKKVIQLTETIKMVPLALLPPSWRKDSLKKSNTGSVDDFGEFSAFKPFPIEPSGLERAFLITIVNIKPVLFDYETISEKDSPNLATNEAFTSLNQVRLCLTSIGNCSPLEEFCWKQFSDEVLENASNVSSGMTSRHIEIKPFRLRKSEPIQEEKASQIIKSYFQLTGTFRSQITRALDRLNQAMRRSTVGDMAIELSIALESLLLTEEIGDNQFKVSLRSGIVFSHDLDKRIQCRKIIKDMYGLRSKLVHKGINSNSVPEKREVIEQALTFTSTIIKNLIQNGKLPLPEDWSILELSGKPLEGGDRQKTWRFFDKIITFRPNWL